MWQQYGDTMEWAWTSAENAQDRYTQMAITALEGEAAMNIANEQSGSAAGTAVGNFAAAIGAAYIEHAL
jgi:hypothetical protein